MTDSPPSRPPMSRATCIAIAIIVTLAARAIPAWSFTGWMRRHWFDHAFSRELFADVALLAMGLLLALSAPRQSGLGVRGIKANWRRVTIVCGIPVALAAIVNPMLDEQPWAGAQIGMWLVSPAAQDIVFMGFLFGMFAQSFPGHIHRRIPVSWALLLAALCFVLWHVPNLDSRMSHDFVYFQLGYTFLGAIFVGLARQWSGSIWPGVLAHMACNCIACYTG